jgi:hypothetical protein
MLVLFHWGKNDLIENEKQCVLLFQEQLPLVIILPKVKYVSLSDWRKNYYECGSDDKIRYGCKY